MGRSRTSELDLKDPKTQSTLKTLIKKEEITGGLYCGAKVKTALKGSGIEGINTLVEDSLAQCFEQSFVC